MKISNFKAAPWCREIKVITIIGSVVLLSVPVLVQGHSSAHGRLIGLASLAIWALCLLSLIRGYALADGNLVVKRLLWNNDIPLDKDATASRGEAPSSLRIFGNGGLFSGSGYFWSKETGIYRSFVTAPKKLVWIKTGNRTLLISPDDPEALIAAFSSREEA